MQLKKDFTGAAKSLRLVVTLSTMVFFFVVMATGTLDYVYITHDKYSASLMTTQSPFSSPENLCFAKYADSIPGLDQLKVYNQTQQIFYNRMPKCGSETTMRLFRKAASMNHWHYPRENRKIWEITYKRHDYWVADEKTLLSVVKMAMKHPKPMLFSCHFNYIDFSRLWTGAPPTYINIIRKPQDRLVSLYYYHRFAPRHIRPMSEKRRMMSYDECVMLNDPECTSNSTSGYWTLIPYFCGHDPVCREPTREALERAKRNVVESHAVIGLTEDMENFTKVLEAMIPNYFKGLPGVYRKMQTRNKTHANRNTHHKAAPNKTTVEMMRPLLNLENEFYDFVRERFYALVEFFKCKGN